MNSKNYNNKGGDAVGFYISQMEKAKPQVAEMKSQQARLSEYNKDFRKGLSNPSSPSLSDSYNRMGFGKIGSLGGRMGELEKASLRLGEAAAGRRLKEQAAEAASKSRLAGQEFGYQSKLQAQKAKEEERLAIMSGKK